MSRKNEKKVCQTTKSSTCGENWIKSKNEIIENTDFMSLVTSTNATYTFPKIIHSVKYDQYFFLGSSLLSKENSLHDRMRNITR